MSNHSKIDEAIDEITDDLEKLSTECESEIERIRVIYEQKKVKLSNALNHLQQAKTDLATDNQITIVESANTNNDTEPKQTQSKDYENFPVKSEVRKILYNKKGEFSPREVNALLEKKFPGILESINHSSVHRALNDFVKSDEMKKGGRGKYEVLDKMSEYEPT